MIKWFSALTLKVRIVAFASLFAAVFASGYMLHVKRCNAKQLKASLIQAKEVAEGQAEVIKAMENAAIKREAELEMYRTRAEELEAEHLGEVDAILAAVGEVDKEFERFRKSQDEQIQNWFTTCGDLDRPDESKRLFLTPDNR